MAIVEILPIYGVHFYDVKVLSFYLHLSISLYFLLVSLASQNTLIYLS